MSTLPITEAATSTPSTADTAQLLICVPSFSGEGTVALRARIASDLPGQNVLVATLDAAPGNASQGGVTMLTYPAQSGSGDTGWALTAKDYLAASQLSVEHGAAATLILGAEAMSLSTEGLQRMVTEVTGQKADLVVPRYRAGPHDALVSSAMLYPLTHALFGGDVHLPLPLDVAFSKRMAQRLTIAARKPGAGAQQPDLLWPVAEAAMASFVVREVAAGQRTLPHPSNADLNSLLTEIVGSMFADIDAKANFWQRARAAVPAKPSARPAELRPEASEDVQEMAEGFRNAYANLEEIWSLVLPPQSLLGLKKLSRASADEFEMPANLWARTLYDFVLAFHLRTINRGHLLGSFTPLYLAWVASHLRRSGDDVALAESHVEETAAAFVAEKPYLVARWRWPDRFNP